jgi:hypothetical protein
VKVVPLRGKDLTPALMLKSALHDAEEGEFYSSAVIMIREDGSYELYGTEMNLGEWAVMSVIIQDIVSRKLNGSLVEE